jgi:hypothetical protein
VTAEIGPQATSEQVNEDGALDPKPEGGLANEKAYGDKGDGDRIQL